MRCIALSATPANTYSSIKIMERLAGVEPAISALATQRLRAVPESTRRLCNSEGWCFLEEEHHLTSCLSDYSNSGTAVPLDYSRSSSGSGRGIRTQTIRGSKDHCPAIRRSRNILLSSSPGHTPLFHVSYSTDIVINWLVSKASNLDFRVQSAACCPVTLLAINSGCAGGSRTRITLINSQVLCQLRYRAMLPRN